MKTSTNDQSAPVIEVEQLPEMLIEQPLNKIDVDTLVKEEERLRELILSANQSFDGSDNKLENLSTVLLQALHTKDEQLVAFALEKDVRIGQYRMTNSSKTQCATFLRRKYPLYCRRSPSL